MSVLVQDFTLSIQESEEFITVSLGYTAIGSVQRKHKSNNEWNVLNVISH